MADDVTKLRTEDGNGLQFRDIVQMVTAASEDCNVLVILDCDANRCRPKDILIIEGVSIMEAKPPLRVIIPQNAPEFSDAIGIEKKKMKNNAICYRSNLL